jgi:hypothetical protein
MIETITLGVLAALAFFIMFPAGIRRKLMGYGVAFDILASTVLVATYATTSTTSGLAIAVVGAVVISLGVKNLKVFEGYEIAEIDGERRLSKNLLRLVKQGSLWTKAVVRAAYTGVEVTPPEPLNIRWIVQFDEKPASIWGYITR